jgi:hypothetical protein
MWPPAENEKVRPMSRTRDAMKNRTPAGGARCRSIFVALVIATSVCAPLPTAAQVEDRPHGFYLGLAFVGSSLHIDDEGESIFFVKDDGGGALLRAGYSFNRVFSLELSIGGANHETSVQAIDANVGLVQLFLHYRFAPGHAFRPYVKGGLGGYSVELEDNNTSVRIEGGGVPFGAGFDYFFSRHFSLGVDLTYNVIEYETLSLDLGSATAGFDIDEEGAMTSLGLALTYYF